MARKILLADDSVTAQNMGRKILADAGYEVITVNNGSAALKKIGEQHPDVIVLDVYMPGYSGLEVCQRLKEVSETSRIPILLTVGKLEPFKPEEARRVRADAFIVKPFEASELLSALTKLEDKIVPHAESSKPGRFGRAAAAMDERPYDKTMTIEEDTGWKSRIAFPSKKKEKVDDEDAETSKPAPVAAHAPTAPKAGNFDDEKVDLGALAPGGLPKDVTPEEIAALAAAAARVKGKLSEDKFPPAEMPVAVAPTTEESKKEEIKPDHSAALPTPKSMAGPGPIYSPEPKTESRPEPKSDTRSEAPAAKAEERPAETLAEPADEPVTMAVATQSGPAPSRWTAVGVALAPEDSAISLEQEMQKAFAVSAGAEGSHSASASMIPAVAESATPSTSEPEAAAATPVAEPETANAVQESASAAVSELETMASSFASQSSAPVETSPAVLEPPIAPEATFTAPVPEESASATVAPAELAHPESAEKIETGVTSHAPSDFSREDRFTEDRKEESSHKASPTIEVSAEKAAESTAAEQPSSRIESEIETRTESKSETEPAAASDLAAAATAALDSWKHDHESAGNGTSSPPASGNSSKPEDSSKQDVAAMAAAVGAKNPVDEKSLESDPDVASIVDSVLADLRPKIVQEISRKLGKR